MGYRVIAVISTFLTAKEALEFAGSYNRNTRGCHSAALVDGPAVHMLEHDTGTEAETARAKQSDRQICEWCEECVATMAEGLCATCWDKRERMKAEGEGQ